MDVRPLIDAILEAIDARLEEKTAREGYDGGSWGYHGWQFIERRERAEHQLGIELQNALSQQKAPGD